ncbi:MAG: hypothetical protein ACO386_03430 [Burkholderiaceae bacterium]
MILNRSYRNDLHPPELRERAIRMGTTIRFCFAKQETTLDEAIQRLQRLG